MKNAIYSVIEKEELILHDPEPFVAVSELADSSVNFIVRAWTKTEDYWTVRYRVLEHMKDVLEKQGVSLG